jgi:uncharacterized protein
MIVDWDEHKNLQNQKKHGLSFETAQHIFDDPHHLSIQDRHECSEERWQTLGIVGDVVVILVAHTISENINAEMIRIISARKATTHERKQYEEQR